MPALSKAALVSHPAAAGSIWPAKRWFARRRAWFVNKAWAPAWACLALTACGNAPFPSGTVEELFPTGRHPEFTSTQVQGQAIGSARVAGLPTSPATKPMLLFVHGSPGSWKAWSGFLKAPELADYKSRVSVDRPGFGASSALGVMPDLRKQAAMLTELIPPGQKAIVIGHSLGAPLAAWMAIDAPDRVCGVVSIAGSLSSVYEAPRWYNQLADSVLVNWAISPEMLRSNQEMMPLQTELAKLELALPSLKTPFILMQGGKDSLVDPRTADEVEKRAPKRWMHMQRLPQEGHFLLWEKPQLVNAAIHSLKCS